MSPQNPSFMFLSFFLLVLVDEKHELLSANCQVLWCHGLGWNKVGRRIQNKTRLWREAIRNVPTNGSKLSAILKMKRATHRLESVNWCTLCNGMKCEELPWPSWTTAWKKQNPNNNVLKTWPWSRIVHDICWQLCWNRSSQLISKRSDKNPIPVAVECQMYPHVKFKLDFSIHKATRWRTDKMI